MVPEGVFRGMLESFPMCCVDLVIARKGRVLLVKRSREPARGEWWIVGGRILKNETFEKAVIRKAREEAGLKVRVKNRIGTYETFFRESPFPEARSGIHTINVCFLAEPLKGEVRLDGNHSRFRWISRMEKGLQPYVRQVLRDSDALTS